MPSTFFSDNIPETAFLVASGSKGRTSPPKLAKVIGGFHFLPEDALKARDDANLELDPSGKQTPFVMVEVDVLATAIWDCIEDYNAGQ